MPIDYETLRVIWWLLIGVLLTGFAVTDGFDMGVAFLLPILSRNDTGRRIMINSIGPVWEGNQVWFILGGGALFAAWPIIYAVSFSSFYFAMLLVLLALILRPVGFKYRSKLQNPTWRKLWDIGLFIGGFVPPLVFGVAIGNVLEGIPFHFNDDLRMFYTGHFLDLFNPFALSCGLLCLMMFVMHGAVYLTNKVAEPLKRRAEIAGRISAIGVFLFFIICGLFVAYKLKGYVLTSDALANAFSNPLNKKVLMLKGAWFRNYQSHAWMMIAPIIALLSTACVFIVLCARTRLAFVFSSLSLGSIIATFGLSMFPFILPSASHPSQSLLVWDSSSSQLTLFIMLIAVIFFMPIILAYTGWVYKVLRGPIDKKFLEENSDNAY